MRNGQKTAIILVGYHYLSTPMYLALKEQLHDFRLFYVFTKDTIASDTNYKFFDRSVFANDPNYVELGYDPPWFRGLMAWHVRGKVRKTLLWLRWVFAFGRFKREIMKLVGRLNPDLIITTSDMFFTPRYLARKLPRVPIAVLQPCYLDLWERPYRFRLIKRLVNVVQPELFERQQYFGLEIERAALLVWEPAAYETYLAKGRRTERVINPAHLQIRKNAKGYRADRAGVAAELELPAGERIVAVFPAYYGDVVGHGDAYQQSLEASLVDAVARLRDRFTLVIKVHPNEDMAYWRRVFERFGDDPRVILIHHIERFKLMAVSEFHVSTNSYAAVEATLSGTAAVNFIPGIAMIGETFCAPFSRNAALVCTTVDQLVEALSVKEGAAAYQKEVADAQDRIIGEKAGYRPIQDIFSEIT
jgi:hypothetical protein